MSILKPTLALTSAALAAALIAGTLHGTPAVASTQQQQQSAASPQHLSHSPELWATINVCDPKNAPDVVGVRASMPGDGQSKDVMYMRFRLEYLDTTTGKWVELGHSADSGMLLVGSASAARQYGRSFTLAASAQPFKLRGLVGFEWLRGKRVVYATERTTSAPHKSSAGADPTGFSSATCLLS